VILDVHGKMTLATPKRDPLWHGPARQQPIPLEPEVVVQAPRCVSLDDETETGSALPSGTERLGRLPCPPTAPVLVESHPVDCRLKRNTIFINRLHLSLLPCSERFRRRG
jgi:hypothetical protein